METWGHEITPFCMTNTSKGFVVCFTVCPSPQIMSETNWDTYTMAGEGRFPLAAHAVRKSSGPHYCLKTTLYHLLHWVFFFFQKVESISLNCPLSAPTHLRGSNCLKLSCDKFKGYSLSAPPQSFYKYKQLWRLWGFKSHPSISVP